MSKLDEAIENAKKLLQVRYFNCIVVAISMNLDCVYTMPVHF